MDLSRFIRRDLDTSLLAAVLVATFLGILMIYSATYDLDKEASGVIYQKQVAWAAVGLLALALTVIVPIKFYYVFAYVLYGAAVLLLVLVLKVGDRRWFNLGPIYVQPSELAKVATVLALARYLSMRNLNLNRFRGFGVPLLFVLVPVALVFKQPDLGTALVFGAVLLPMLYWAGLHPVNLFFIVSPALSLICAFHSLALGIFILLLVAVIFKVRSRLPVIAALVSVNLVVAIGAPYLWNYRLHDYQRRRILTFLNPDTDKLGAGYQLIQSQVAIGSGGLHGKGFLEGTQTKLAFLPEQHTDFIFSVVGEEFGFLGAVVVLSLLFFIVYRAFQTAVVVQSRFSSLVVVGLASILAFHTFVNIGMTIGVMPVVGIPLPFFSYGGSPLVANMVIAGLLLNIHARRHENY